MFAEECKEVDGRLVSNAFDFFFFATRCSETEQQRSEMYQNENKHAPRGVQNHFCCSLNLSLFFALVHALICYDSGPQFVSIKQIVF